MNKTIQSRIQHPVHTAATLTAKNPVLLKGEVVYESDTRKHKIGDGATAWNALSYVGGANYYVQANKLISSNSTLWQTF